MKGETTMQIYFTLDDNEKAITPLKVVEALIDQDIFNHKELKEIIAYLSVYTKYNADELNRR
jgi:hypothetical protein